MQAAEVGARDASARTWTAVVACGASTVRNRENGGAADRQAAIRKLLRNCLLDHNLRAVHLHRRQELSIRKLRQSFCLSRDADEVFHVVIPGLDVFVADWPIDTVAILEVGLKV